jgi:HSP20 family protein
MAESVTKLPISKEAKSVETPVTAREWRPFELLRREVDQLFDDFGTGFWRSPFRRAVSAEPFWRRGAVWNTAPAVDVTETEKAYNIVAELPGIDEKNVEVKLTNGILTIKGEKQEEKEEKKKDYYLRECQYGKFERSFELPDGVDQDKIEANVKKGVLTVTLPKTAEAQTAEKKIAIKAA